MKIVVVVALFFSLSTWALPIQFQCGENSQLYSVKNENLTVDLTYQFKDLSRPDSSGVIELSTGKFEMADLIQVTRYALHEGVDPFVMMGLFVNEKGSLSAEGLGTARFLDCDIKPRSELKITKKADVANVPELNEKLRKLTAERNSLNGGDDFDEWMDSQKEIEKQLRLIDQLKAQMKKEKGEKRAEIGDQISDAQEEIKGLQKEQEEFVKSPVMKKIAAIEAERFKLRSQLEGLRQQAEARANNPDAGVEFNKDWECLRSDKCLGVLVKSEKPKEIDLSLGLTQAAPPATSLVCIEGDLLRNEIKQLSAGKGVCCAQVKIAAGRKAALDLKSAAVARLLRENFMGCAAKDTVADCLVKYFEFKGECGRGHGFQVTAATLSEILSSPRLNTMVGIESQRLKKPIVSAFCSSLKKTVFAMDHETFLEEAKKFALAHKTCTTK